jgi:predicted AlkP superfamily phosphohydrolase/phosphomutase
MAPTGQSEAGKGRRSDPPPNEASPPATRRAPVILIGLDSADLGLVDRWCASGDLPFLESLRQRGAWGPLHGPPGLADDAAWACFYTGVSPGSHGRYHWHTPAPASYQWNLWRDVDHAAEPFWSALGRANRRVAVIDVPKCPLTPGLNGIQISDWLVHGRDYPEVRTWPPELAASVLSRFGGDRTDHPGPDWLCRLESLPDDLLPTLRHHLLDGVRKKVELATGLLQQEHWDLFLVVFKEAHCAGHQFWHMLDGADDGGGPAGEVYRALDSAVREIAQCASPEASIIVFSDLGMAANETGEHYLDSILRLLEPKLATPAQRLRMLARRLRRRWHHGGGDPMSDRLVYQTDHNEISGAIRINLIGREPAGTVRTNERKSLSERLARELLALRDATTGLPVIESVLQSDQQFPGSNRERLPDLFAVWDRRTRPQVICSPLIGSVSVEPHGFRPGNHVAGGFYIAAGSNIAPAGAGLGAEPAASLMDLAPTVAQLLGTQLPACEGKPIARLCGP